MWNFFIWQRVDNVTKTFDLVQSANNETRGITKHIYDIIYDRIIILWIVYSSCKIDNTV